MSFVSNKVGVLALSSMLVFPALGSAAAQELEAVESQPESATVNEETINVYGTVPSDLTGMVEGPEIEGMISARQGNAMQVTAEDGTPTTVRISEGTEVRARGGFLGLGRTELTINQLLNGLPVQVRTVRWGEGLIASRISFTANDLEIAQMIRGGTDQRFAMNEAAIGENEAAIEENAAATEALRGRVANIDQYNVRGTTNVYFDTGRWNLSPQAQVELCQAAAEAEAMDNALLLVVGYTDSVGDQDFNQELSERRAGRVVNFLQQECDWAPWRMLTPTGMAESDPAADNSTAAGRAQNRRVSVNILVSKAVDNL